MKNNNKRYIHLDLAVVKRITAKYYNDVDKSYYIKLENYDKDILINEYDFYIYNEILLIKEGSILPYNSLFKMFINNVEDNVLKCDIILPLYIVYDYLGGTPYDFPIYDLTKTLKIKKVIN